MSESFEPFLITRVGLVTARIAPGHMGEVRLRVGGGTEDYLAVAQEPDAVFELNVSVAVVGVLPGRIAVVRASSL